MRKFKPWRFWQFCKYLTKPMRICANYIIENSQNLTGWKYPLTAWQTIPLLFKFFTRSTFICKHNDVYIPCRTKHNGTRIFLCITVVNRSKIVLPDEHIFTDHKQTFINIVTLSIFLYTQDLKTFYVWFLKRYSFDTQNWESTITIQFILLTWISFNIQIGK